MSRSTKDPEWQRSTVLCGDLENDVRELEQGEGKNIVPMIVTFDVPPPEDGVRGIDAYRQTWPSFFEWQARAPIEIRSLDVTAGEDVAFACALVRCGTREELDKDPANRLRVTIELRKEVGRWLVAHEHRLFPDKDAAA